ncbi:MAG: hypothetical protein AAF266_16095, partial [Planctomycetota bacterium]
MTEIDAFLDDLDRLAATAPVDDPSVFYEQVVPTSASAIGADAAELSQRLPGSSSPVRWFADGGGDHALIDSERSERLSAEG